MKLLFLCVANSARSQMAEGLARDYFAKQGRSDVEIQSAGSHPSGIVHPLAIQVLQEVNIDIRAQRSKSVTDIAPEFVDNLDFAITLCAEEVCPVLPSRAKSLHWGFPDPAGNANDAEQAFRQVRDGILEKLAKL